MRMHIHIIAVLLGSLLAAVLPTDACGDPDIGPGQAGFIELPGPGSGLRAYLAVPQGIRVHRAVVISHGRREFDADLISLTHEFARRDYVALMLAPMQGRPDDTAPLGRALEFLAKRFDVKHDNVSLVGFCGGGYQALLYAARRGPALAAVVVFYGPIAFPERFQPDAGRPFASLQGIAGTIASPVQGHYGTADHIVDLEGVKRFRVALGGESEFHFYKGAGHGFGDRFHGAFDPNASRLARQRMFEFLDQRTSASR